MKTGKTWTIDTNIIVQWLMLKQIMPFAIKKFNLTQEFLATYESRYYSSIGFINRVLELPEKEQQFFVIEISLNELFSGIRDEIRTIMLFVKGVPISRWAYKRETKEVSFPTELSRKIYELTSQGFDILFVSKKIGIIPATVPSDNPDYFEVYSSLIFLNPELKTQDAILITTAIFEKINYFVTMDKDLIKLGKQLEQTYNIKVIGPEFSLKNIAPSS